MAPTAGTQMLQNLIANYMNSTLQQQQQQKQQRQPATTPTTPKLPSSHLLTRQALETLERQHKQQLKRDEMSADMMPVLTPPLTASTGARTASLLSFSSTAQ